MTDTEKRQKELAEYMRQKAEARRRIPEQLLSAAQRIFAACDVPRKALSPDPFIRDAYLLAYAVLNGALAPKVGDEITFNTKFREHMTLTPPAEAPSKPLFADESKFKVRCKPFSQWGHVDDSGVFKPVNPPDLPESDEPTLVPKE